MARVYVLAGTKPIVMPYPVKSSAPSGDGSTEVLEKGRRNVEIPTLNSSSPSRRGCGSIHTGGTTLSLPGLRLGRTPRGSPLW
jgi:hypothetical protein